MSLVPKIHVGDIERNYLQRMLAIAEHQIVDAVRVVLHDLLKRLRSDLVVYAKRRRLRLHALGVTRGMCSLQDDDCGIARKAADQVAVLSTSLTQTWYLRLSEAMVREHRVSRRRSEWWGS
jgi:hypothetical protein